MVKISRGLAVGLLLALGGEAFAQGRGNCGGGMRPQMSGGPQQQRSMSSGNNVQQMQAYARQSAMQAQQQFAQQLQAQQMLAQMQAQQQQMQLLQMQQAQAQQLAAAKAKKTQLQKPQLQGGN